MSVIAKFRYLHIAPRKVRLVADAIRGKKVEKAQAILSFLVKKSSAPLLKLLNSAIANAENNFKLDKTDLYIQKIIVDEGPKNKRWHAQSRGRAAEILKRTSHITIVLETLSGNIKEIVKPAVKTVSEKKVIKTKKQIQKSGKKTTFLKKRPETKKVYRRKSI